VAKVSAQDNLSTQLFRGFTTSKVQEPLGIHWSSVEGLTGKDKSASGSKFDTKGVGASLFANPAPGEKHSIVSANVHPEDVANGYDTEFYEKHDIWGAGHPEYEEPVYPGSKVEVTGVTRVRNVDGIKKLRKITYKKPREMKA
jgi:hypothetical protein